ncbi:MAG: GNAT family N-acetyltransferase, partial [Syntrophobacteraceae bacterium]
MIRIIDPIRDPQWDRILASLPDHSFFLGSYWARVLNESYSFKPLYFMDDRANALSSGQQDESFYSGNREGSESPAPCIIPIMEIDSFLTGKRGVSLPFTDYCDPLVTDKNSFSILLDHVLKYGKEAGWKYLELRGGSRFFNGMVQLHSPCGGVPGRTKNATADQSWTSGAVPHKTYFRHTLRIHGTEEEQFRRIKHTARRNIRTALKAGIRIAISDLESDLSEYYRLHCLTRKRHGVPPQPWSFFKSIHRHVISSGNGFVVLGRHQGRAIAGAVFFHSKRRGIYKFGASDMQFQHLRANNLVMWEAIRWFIIKGFEELCFGRTDQDNAGLVRFKRGWGTHEEVLQYFRYDLGRSVFEKNGPRMEANAVFKCMPIPLLRL